ncbi:hypothetical protein BGZ65_012755 [Modicella reniformis]|uniref:GSKIP domain-containing protein n=1 Tax=Modicella reniformis TaxID=1440133 RepID=A0A9P6IRT0_9FUNG|nr:hypothetical protein BGZ65_012755 [Modicella reniformis]
MADLIPNLTHYAGGLDPATFPLRIVTQGDGGNVLSVRFVVVTLEQYSSEIALSGQGYYVESLLPPEPRAAPILLNTDTSPASESATSLKSILSARQQEALSGMIYETIEALLMALSPGFEDFFGQELSRKLGAIAWEQLQERQEMGSSESDDGGGNGS